MVTELTAKPLSATSILKNVDAVPMSVLPEIWQQVVRGEADISHPFPTFLVALARLFATKKSEATIFGEVSVDEAAMLQRIYDRKIRETLEFYGNDWLQSSYPDWDLVLETANLEQDQAERVVRFVQSVFNEFGYELPASFYWMLLHPVERDTLTERRPMAFDQRMQGVARQFDASLHALNVTKVALRIQAIASEHGLQLHHGCGCENHLTDLTIHGGKVEFEFADEVERHNAIIAFIWRIWNEYAFFQFAIQSNTLAL